MFVLYISCIVTTSVFLIVYNNSAQGKKNLMIFVTTLKMNQTTAHIEDQCYCIKIINYYNKVLAIHFNITKYVALSFLFPKLMGARVYAKQNT